MEHILQFGVTIDDEAIINHAKQRASEKVLERVTKEIESYTDGWQETKLDRLFRDEIKKLLDEHKAEIIEKASEHLMANMVKTKAVREAIGEVLSEVE